MNTPVEELVSWEIPNVAGQRPTKLQASCDRCIVFVGPNGSGKSALSFWLSQNGTGVGAGSLVRVLAHRKIWLSSSGAEITSGARSSLLQQRGYYDSQEDSRVKDSIEGQRAGLLMFDLLGQIFNRDHRYANAVESKELTSDEALTNFGESPLHRLNRIFTTAGLDVAFAITEQQDFVARRHGFEYPIADMSDGEKGAFLLAAQALVVPAKTVLLIDEPERHFHRAVSARLVAAVVQERQDCAFVLFTHDLDVAEQISSVDVVQIVVKSVAWETDKARGWDLQEMTVTGLPENEELRKAILGGRRRLLCVEGATSSLDLNLYALLFPDWTVVPSGGADEVRKSVRGMQGTQLHHWVHCRGLVDGDASQPGDAQALRAKGILSLPVNEIESLFYLSWATVAMARRQAEALSDDYELLCSNVRSAILKAVNQQDVMKNLAAANAQKKMRRSALAQLPDRDILRRSGSTVAVQVASDYPSELTRLKQHVDAEDTEAIVSEYSIRSSSVRADIAAALGYRDHAQYERALRTALSNDEELLERVRSLVGQIPD